MFDVALPRHACSPRDRARAADLWRLVQEATIRHSAACGWPPPRYREEGCAFVVREMTGVHLREAEYGEPLRAWSRVVTKRRDLLMRRDAGIEGVLRATVEWVHIGPDGAPCRAPKHLVDAFPVEGEVPEVELPSFEAGEPLPLPELAVRPWWTEMDPMGHVNHPRYLEWADEAVCAWIGAEGRDPFALVPVAERVRFRSAAKAGDDVRVRGALVGRAGDAAVFQLRAWRGDEALCDAWLVRGWAGERAPWAPPVGGQRWVRF